MVFHLRTSKVKPGLFLDKTGQDQIKNRTELKKLINAKDSLAPQLKYQDYDPPPPPTPHLIQYSP